jgi:hypothetical protein
MTHEFAYPRVTQIAPRAHAVQAGAPFSASAAKETAGLVWPRPSAGHDRAATASS